MTRHPQSRPTSERVLIGLETATGALAVAGGALLIAREDGSLLGADTSILARSPFDSWRVPGVLLTTLVGGGFLGAAAVLRSRAPRPIASALSIGAGLGLVAFESFEVVWLGIQPLELIFAGVGAVVAGLGLVSYRRSSAEHLAGSHG